MELSKVAETVNESVTLAVTDRAKELKAQGIDIISFGAGEPDFDTPDFIKAAAKQALDNGATKYAPAAGVMDLRQEIARKLKTENNLDYSPKQVVVTCGAKHAVYLALHALIDPGDEVLIPKPYWVSYPEMVKLVGGVPKFADSSPENCYKLTAATLKKQLTSKTKAIIINSPNNPGGFCYTPEELATLGKVIADFQAAVISDEIYEYLVFNDQHFASFAAVCPELYERTITINGLSKAYSMTGWRIGYLAAPLELAKAVSRLQSHMTSGTATFNQLAAISALQNGQAEVKKMREEFNKRAHLIYERLNEIPGFECQKLTGAFYAFPKVSACYAKLKVSGSVEFCQLLLEKAQVACVPGLDFGCDENIRLSFATSREQINKGIDRIKKFIENS
ncbi:MAG: pyridoxal phosphate-dependent aminotransferase [Pseudomonadota bacterium]